MMPTSFPSIKINANLVTPLLQRQCSMTVSCEVPHRLHVKLRKVERRRFVGTGLLGKKGVFQPKP